MLENHMVLYTDEEFNAAWGDVEDPIFLTDCDEDDEELWGIFADE